MKKDYLEAIFFIGLLIFVILTYPFFVEVKDGNMTCRNILGQEVKCR